MIDVSRQSEPDPVGEELGGKWIAWDDSNIHVVAMGMTADEARGNALAAGVRDPILEFVPPADAAFMGGVSNYRTGLTAFAFFMASLT